MIEMLGGEKLEIWDLPGSEVGPDIGEKVDLSAGGTEVIKGT